MGCYKGDALAIMNGRQIIGYFRDLAETWEPRIDMAGPSRVDGIVLPEGDEVGRRRRDDGHAQIGAHEHALPVTRFDDTIRRLPVLHSKARYIHAFRDQCVSDLVACGVPANSTCISGLGAGAASENRVIHAVAAGEHQILLAIAVNNVIAESDNANGTIHFRSLLITM